MYAMLKVAALLFGPETLIIMTYDTNGNSVVLIPAEKIVFDAYNWYFQTRDGDDFWNTDAEYDDMVNVYSSDIEEEGDSEEEEEDDERDD